MSNDPNQQDLANREFENIIPGISPGIRNLQMQGFQQVTLVGGQVFPMMTGYVQMGPSPINTYNNQQVSPGVAPFINPVVLGGPIGENREPSPNANSGEQENQRHSEAGGQCLPDPDGQFLNLEECQETVNGEETDENGVVIGGGGGGGGGGALPTIHAKLTERSTSTSPSFSGHSLWNWTEVFIKNQGSTFSFAVDNSTSRTAQQYGSFPNGRAIELQGYSLVGDIVELTPIKGLDGKQWFTFVGREHPPLVIELGGGQIFEGVYRYTAYPQQWDDTNNRFTSHIFYKAGFATNFCKPVNSGASLLRDSYGQEMIFGPGRLELGDPLTSGSLVIGAFRNVTNAGDWEYVFSERLNVSPFCEVEEP